jgi:hypothetical protein
MISKIFGEYTPWTPWAILPAALSALRARGREKRQEPDPAAVAAERYAGLAEKYDVTPMAGGGVRIGGLKEVAGVRIAGHAAAAVPTERERRAADALASFFAHDLGLDDPIAVEWFDGGDDGRGYMLSNDPTTIYICTGLSDDELIFVVAHEARHCWQFATGQYLADSDGRERDAVGYGNTAKQNLRVVAYQDGGAAVMRRL